MTGPLRRLTSRFSGEGLPRVQAMTRLPFGPIPTVQTEWPTSGTPADDARPEKHWPDAAPQQSLVPLKATDKTSDLSEPQATAGTPTTRQRDDLDLPRFSSPLIQPPAQPIQPAATATFSLGEPIQRHRTQSEKATNPAPLEPQQRDLTQALPRQPGSPTQINPTPSHGWPSPLLPPSTTGSEARDRQRDEATGTASHTQPAPQRSALRGTVSPPAGLQPHEVHVHIGRIEVTALHEPPASAPTKAKRNGAPPLSLDDYLAKRRSKA